jgi:hypothetical protein
MGTELVASCMLQLQHLAGNQLEKSWHPLFKKMATT